MGFKMGFVKATVYDLDWSSRCSMVIGSCSREQQQEALQKSRFIVHSWARSKFSSFCRSCLLWNPKTKRSKTKKQGCVVGCVVWWPSIIMDNDTAECPTIPRSRRLIFEYSYIARLKKTHHERRDESWLEIFVEFPIFMIFCCRVAKMRTIDCGQRRKYVALLCLHNPNIS